MINRRLAGIVLAPVDRRALIGVVERAAREGIPVSIFDSGIDTDRRISCVATDNTEAGRMGARRMAEILEAKGKVGIIGFMPGSASTMERESGFQEEIRRWAGIQIVGLQFGMADRAKAMGATENLLTAHPGLAGLFADNESSSSGAVQALKTRAIGLKLAGQVPPKHIDSGASLVRREDLDKPAVRELLFPDIQACLRGPRSQAGGLRHPKSSRASSWPPPRVPRPPRRRPCAC